MKKLSVSNLLTTNEEPSDRKWCYYCSKSLSTPSNLKKHVRRRNSTVLSIRNRALTARETSQINKVHKQTRRIGCPFKPCKFRADAKDGIRRHVRSCHTTGNPFQCEVCPCSFSTLSKLVKHMKGIHQSGREKGEGTTGLQQETERLGRM